MKDKFYITAIVSGDFYSFHRRAMLENLARYIYPNKLIIINRPLNIFDLIKNRTKFSRAKYDYSISENLIIINSYIPIHDRLSINFNVFFNKINFSSLKKDFLNLIVKEKISKIDNYLIIMHPNLINYVPNITYKYLIYDCYDEFITTWALKGIEKREKELVKISDIVITSSRYLMNEKRKKYQKEMILHMPTAIDLNLIKNISKKLPEDIKDFIDRKVIGFGGAFRQDLDIDILTYIIEKRPNYNFLFVGETFNNEVVKLLSLYKNVRFVGKKTIKEFLNYLYFFDVAIAPHLLTKVMISASPYKIFQYLAFNLPIISTPIPEVEYLKENTNLGQKYIEISNSKEDFLMKLDLCINKKYDSLYDEMHFKELSWDSRFNNLFQYINEINK